MAGTGNDYIGGINITRSNRTCARWDFQNSPVNPMLQIRWNNTLFADMSATKADNMCRNPSRDVAGKRQR